MAGEKNWLDAAVGEPLRYLAAQHVHYERTSERAERPGLVREASDFENAVALRCAVVEDDIDHIDELLTRRMGGFGPYAMLATDDADHLQTPPACALSHLNNDLADAAGRDDDHHVMRAEREIAQDLLGVTKRLFQVQTLPQ